MATLYKLSNVREAMSKALGKTVERNLMHYYTTREDFPEPVVSDPIRLWNPDEVEAWIAQEVRRRKAS